MRVLRSVAVTFLTFAVVSISVEPAAAKRRKRKRRVRPAVEQTQPSPEPAAPTPPADPVPVPEADPPPVASAKAPVKEKPATVEATERREASASDAAEGAATIAVLLGGEFGVGEADYSALKLRLDGAIDLMRLTPRLAFAAAASLGVWHTGDEGRVSVPPLGRIDYAWYLNVFELTPAARLVFDLSERLAIYADLGVGFVYAAGGASVSFDATPSAAGTGDSAGAVLRLGGGLTFAAGEHLRFGVEPAANIRFVEDSSLSGLSLLLTASHAY